MEYEEQDRVLKETISKFAERWEEKTGIKIDTVETEIAHLSGVSKLVSFKFVFIEIP